MEPSVTAAPYTCRTPACDRYAVCVVAGKCCYKSSAEEANEYLSKKANNRPGNCIPMTGPADVRAFSGLVDGSGKKESLTNPKKLPLWLVPGSLVRAAARAMGFGAKKYGENDWRRGMSWKEVLGALDRHLQEVKDGRMFDEETGLHHLDHMAANIAFLTAFIESPEYTAFNDLFVHSTP